MLSNYLAQLTAFLGTGEATGGSYWFPEQASTNAANTDWLFDFILWISVFFLILIVGLLVAFVWNYRSRPGVVAEATATHHTPLELTWTIIPTILVVIIFYFGISGYIDTRTPPRNAHEIQVTAQKWKWTFVYPNGYADTAELHLPVGEPTRLLMRSEDVIHSLFIPAFRTKMDVVPGRYNKMWFTPTQVGKYHLFCAEYCGDEHSHMGATVVVESPDDYQQWLEGAEKKLFDRPPVELGELAYKKWGCQQCHSLDGTRGIGPSFKGLYGRHEQFTDGSALDVDENYIRESILEPQAKVVAGFVPVMPTFKGKLKDQEIHGIIEYIKTLK